MWQVSKFILTFTQPHRCSNHNFTNYCQFYYHYYYKLYVYHFSKIYAQAFYIKGSSPDIGLCISDKFLLTLAALAISFFPYIYSTAILINSIFFIIPKLKYVLTYPSKICRPMTGGPSIISIFQN